MSAFRMRRRAVLVKLETTYGTDSVPTASANAVLCRTVTVTPLAGDDVQRELIRSYYGNAQMLAGDKHVELELEVELAGSGTAGTPPAWSPLIQACGFAETDGASDTVFNPITGDETSISCYIHRDGIRHIFTGGRGSVSFGLSVNQIPTMTFRFLGLLGTISATAMPTAVYTPWQTPLVVNSTNTPTFTLHAANLSFSELTMDMAVEAVKHSVVGPANSIQIVDRAPSGTVVVEEPPLATINLYEKSRDATLGALALTHGTAAGNIISFAAPKVGIGAPSEQDLNGVQMLSVPLTITPDAGNDELVITLT